MAIPIAHVLTYFLGLTRILAMIVHIPMIAGRLVPNLVKVGVGILLAITILPPATLEHVEMMNTFLELTIAIGREILIGSLVGFGATLTFGAVQITGEIIGLGSGFSAAHILNPIFGTSDTITNQFFGMVSGLLFLVINGHLLFLMAVRQTFDILPLNQPLPSLSLDRLIALAGDLITTGVHLALPVLAALLLTDITLGPLRFKSSSWVCHSSSALRSSPWHSLSASYSPHWAISSDLWARAHSGCLGTDQCLKGPKPRPRGSSKRRASKARSPAARS